MRCYLPLHPALDQLYRVHYVDTGAPRLYVVRADGGMSYTAYTAKQLDYAAQFGHFAAFELPTTEALRPLPTLTEATPCA